MKIYQIDSSARKKGSTSRALAKKLKLDINTIVSDQGQIVTIEIPDDIDAQLRYVIAASRAGLKAIKVRANPGSITVGNPTRGGWLGDNLQKEYDDLFKGDNVDERTESFTAVKDNTSIFALRSALTDHKRDAWYPRVAVKNDK